MQSLIGAGAFQPKFRAGAGDFVAGWQSRISIVSMNTGLQFCFIAVPGLMSGHIHSRASSHECELVKALDYDTPRLLDYSP